MSDRTERVVLPDLHCLVLQQPSEPAVAAKARGLRAAFLSQGPRLQQLPLTNAIAAAERYVDRLFAFCGQGPDPGAIDARAVVGARGGLPGSRGALFEPCSVDLRRAGGLLSLRPVPWLEPGTRAGEWSGVGPEPPAARARGEPERLQMSDSCGWDGEVSRGVGGGKGRPYWLGARLGSGSP
ncbi:hypothetical protein NDU88_005106 [Pleurodeles waltl]|uniref:Uncharacterized protein n=1 Tax=Pleurodeles waltl TaxID=8319 RepID=A0AAV7M9E7_PLEWA|nr:hypothetical protein NDU88_005106 [Pleurodeles waltl]